MTDPHAAEATIREQASSIDKLRHELAQEKELADKLAYCLKELLKESRPTPTPQTLDETVASAMSDYRESRTYFHTN